MPDDSREARPVTSTNPLLVGFIVDVSNSMRRNWHNVDGKPLPRIEVIRDTLNKQIQKYQSDDHQRDKHQSIKMFCLGMGFKVPIHLNHIELSFRQEHHLGHEAEERIYPDVVCDLLALNEILPSERELDEFKQKLDEKWREHTRHVFEQVIIEENVCSGLIGRIRQEILDSATRTFHRGVLYHLHNWLSGRKYTFDRYAWLLEGFEYLSDYVKNREKRITDSSWDKSAVYVNNVMKIATADFKENRNTYITLIEDHLQNFTQGYIRLVLKGLRLGFDIPALVASFDVTRAESIAKEIYVALEAKVRNHIDSATQSKLSYLFWSALRVGAFLDLRKVKKQTEDCVRKYGWDFIKPLIEPTVIGMFEEQFDIQAKKALPYWVSLAATREVIRTVDQVANMLPDVLKQHIYSEEVMFGATPFIEALDRAAIRLLDKRYSSHRKVLIVISDGEFEDHQQMMLSVDLLKKRDIIFIACLVTEKDLPFRLVKRSREAWPVGARLMLELASKASDGSEQLNNLDALSASTDEKLFYQINHSQILNDVIEAILDEPHEP